MAVCKDGCLRFDFARPGVRRRIPVIRDLLGEPDCTRKTTAKLQKNLTIQQFAANDGNRQARLGLSSPTRSLVELPPRAPRDHAGHNHRGRRRLGNIVDGHIG